MFFDAHIHADTRSFEDFERMRIAGIERALTLAHDVYRMSSSDVYFDHYHRLVEVETKRAKKNNMELFVALGIHPSGIPRDYKKVLDELPKYLENEKVVAIGETGLEKLGKEEIEVFEAQVRLAKELDMPIVVHTPKMNKADVAKKTVEILEKIGIDPKNVVIDHATKEVVELLLDKEYYVGLSIQPPSKLSFEEAKEIITEYKLFDRFIVNSDASSIKSEIYALPKLAIMLRSEVSKNDIEKITYWNACRFLRV